MDEIARDYLLLGLSLGELGEGVVDAYYGPPELRAQVRARKPTAPVLVEEAEELRARAAAQVSDPQRHRWLDRQIIGLETIARTFAGEELPYIEEVRREFDATPTATSPETYARVKRQLDDLLPSGTGSLHERLNERDTRLTIPNDRLAGILDWLVSQIRATSAEVYSAPDGESVTLTIVKNEPWSAYNWYEGGLHSLIEFNTDLPTRAPQLVSTLAHETYPGHHLEHAWKEQKLVVDQGRAECSLQLINTPEAYISEGLAEIGWRLVISPERWQELLVGTCDQAGISLTPADARRQWEISEALRGLRGASGDAALMFHAEGRSVDDVRRFLVEDGLASPDRAEKNVRFINHPLWRTYVFCYAGGERLLTDWCSAAGDADAQRARFFRLLTEQLTPSGIAAELTA